MAQRAYCIQMATVKILDHVFLINAQRCHLETHWSTIIQWTVHVVTKRKQLQLDVFNTRAVHGVSIRIHGMKASYSEQCTVYPSGNTNSVTKYSITIQLWKHLHVHIDHVHT